jgi:hypothetical protein
VGDGWFVVLPANAPQERVAAALAEIEASRTPAAPMSDGSAEFTVSVTGKNNVPSQQNEEADAPKGKETDKND